MLSYLLAKVHFCDCLFLCSNKLGNHMRDLFSRKFTYL